MEYVLSMATGDVESRPKGGRPEYCNGPHAKPTLRGKKQGSFMTEETKKQFGWGNRGNSSFRYRAIEQQILSIRWFYEGVFQLIDGNTFRLQISQHIVHQLRGLQLLVAPPRLEESTHCCRLRCVQRHHIPGCDG